MRNVFSLGVGVFAIALMPGCGAAPSPTSPNVPVTTTVTGIITARRPSSTGPLDLATVEVIDGASIGTRAITDRDGRFTLTVPPGDLRLRVSRYNFQAWESKPVTAVSQQTVTIPTVLLTTAPWALSGRVTDSLGRPFAGVQVRDT